MATVTQNRATTAARKVILFSGKGSQARTTALLQVAPLAFQEDVSRAASLANMRKVLGSSPTDAQSKAARVEWIVGRVASRLPVTELPRGKTDPADRMEHARAVVCTMAKAPKPGVKAKALMKGQTGRRSAMQQRIVRAAEEAASLFFNELGIGKGRTLAEKNARQATRAPSMAGSGKGKAATPPAHSELVKPAAPVTSDDYVQHLQLQIAALCAYDAKNAKKRPTTHGKVAALLQALRQAANTAANEYQVRKQAADAKAAEAKK